MSRRVVAESKSLAGVGGPCHEAASPRELVVAWAILSAVLLVQLLGTHQLDLFRHGLWLDETITWLITNDASFAHAMAAVRGGVDTNPPTLYLILWPIARLFGGLNEPGLISVSFISVSLAITGGYAICRRFFDPLPSFAGALAVAAHPTVIGQAFEARFYGPWLAATVWFAFAQMTLAGSRRRGATFVRCVLAVLAGTVHWFGAIALAMISMADLIVHPGPPRAVLRRALPSVCAAIALLACIPFLLGQRDGLTVATWIDPATLGDVKRELTQMLGPMAIVFVLIMSFLARVFGWMDRGNELASSASAAPAAPGATTAPATAAVPAGKGTHLLRELIPFASLLLFPIAIVIFSFAVQPALKERYIMVAAAPLAPLTAWLVARMARLALILTLAGLFAIGAAELVAQAQSFHGKEEEWRRVLAAIDAAPDPLRPLVFKRRHELYPLLRLRPDLLARGAMLDFDGQPSPEVTPLAQYERDMSRRVSRFYPQFRVSRIGALRQGPPFYVISPIQEQLELAALLEPYFDVQPRDQWLYEVTPKR